MRARQRVWLASAVATGLLAVTVLGVAGPPVQAEPTAGRPGPVTPGGDEWWFRSWQVPKKVWPLSAGAGVTVAVLDTGVQASIADLRGVVRPGLDLTGHGSRGEVDADGSGDGHGTALSVVIAGQGYGTGTVGIAPEARILPVEFPYTPGADGDFGSAEVVEAVRFAVEHGARVINMSFGGSVSSARHCDPAEQDVFAYALEHNVVLVASAGNRVAAGPGPVEPASCAGVLAVGAVEPDGSLWPYSTQQPYVAVTAPGADMVYVGRDERYTTTGVGTSFSAALVSAAAALIVSRYPSMPWYQVDQRLIGTALARGRPVPNNAFGYGLVDLAKAVNASAYPVSVTGPNPVYAGFKAWLATPDGRAFAARNASASQKPRPSDAAGPLPRTAASDLRQAGRKSPVLGRIVLIAVALAAAGAFAVLQIRARSRRRSRAAGNRRPGAAYDWRTLPPRYENDPADYELPFTDQDDYGPLWRYGAPRGYGRDYEPGYDPGPDPGYYPGPDPGYGLDRPLPWGFPDDAPHDGWS